VATGCRSEACNIRATTGGRSGGFTGTGGLGQIGPIHAWRWWSGAVSNRRPSAFQFDCGCRAAYENSCSVSRSVWRGRLLTLAVAVLVAVG